MTPSSTTRTVLPSGISMIGPAGEGMISKDICMGCMIPPVQSTTTMVPGNIRCDSTAMKVDGKKRRSSSTVITAATDASTS